VETLVEYLNGTVKEAPELITCFFDLILSSELPLTRLELLLRRVNKHCNSIVQRVQVQSFLHNMNTHLGHTKYQYFLDDMLKLRALCQIMDKLDSNIVSNALIMALHVLV
jgi:hypothetical protein